MDWDLIIAILIIGGIVLAIWAKISHQTIPELLREIKDFFTESSEETINLATEVYA